MTIWPKFDEFLENFETASDPPLPTLFSETLLRFSGGPKICNEIHLDWRDPPPPFSKIHRFYPPQNYRKNRNKIFWIGNENLINLPTGADFLVKVVTKNYKCLPHLFTKEKLMNL